MKTVKKNNIDMVLDVLTKTQKPLSAYEILKELDGTKIKAPPTVYRALEQLQEKGRVHKIESINAFVSCHNNNHYHDGYSSSFAICKACGKVEEIVDNNLFSQLQKLSGKLGFIIKKQTIELVGLCAKCKLSEV